MMAGLSPLTQRIVALGLAGLAALLTLAMVTTVWTAMADALAALEDSRFRLARLEAIRAKTMPPETTPVPPGLVFEAVDHEQASALAVAAANGAAYAVDLALESATATGQDRENPQLIRIALAATGPEEKVLGFIAALERGGPAIRLRSWRIAAAEAGAIRLEGTALAAWGGTP